MLVKDNFCKIFFPYQSRLPDEHLALKHALIPVADAIAAANGRQVVVALEARQGQGVVGGRGAHGEVQEGQGEDSSGEHCERID